MHGRWIYDEQAVKNFFSEVDKLRDSEEWREYKEDFNKICKVI